MKQRSFLAKLHNPMDLGCTCLPECWCQRTRLGRLIRFWVPSEYHRLRPRQTEAIPGEGSRLCGQPLSLGKRGVSGFVIVTAQGERSLGRV
jgi:hypothetical protein